MAAPLRARLGSQVPGSNPFRQVPSGNGQQPQRWLEGQHASPPGNALSDRAQTNELINRVFGADDEQKRNALLNAAKLGNFVHMMELLRQHPHLVNTQGYTGWAVVHQVAFHGPSEGLVRSLVALGARLDLKTHDGETAAQILQRHFPNSTVQMSGANNENLLLEPGKAVIVCLPCGTRKGVVVAVYNDEKQVEIQTTDGVEQEMRRLQQWRVIPARTPQIKKEEELSGGHLCHVCPTIVPTGWKLSPDCRTVHPLCAECAVNYFWAQYTQFVVPFKCPYCPALVSIAERADGTITPGLRRAVERAWPPGSQLQRPLTEITFNKFVENVAERLRGMADDDGMLHTEEMLRLLAITPRGTVNYCDVKDAPLRRACPRCGVTIEYESECKHMTCVKCKHKFCFLCLRDRAEHDSDAYRWDIGFACPVAPIQTAIPQ
eukprot:GGOE01029998.1.p1 GENE.GGOE01029998.1~~GGOE01029998.1.p1  ORF type:complete len:434 (-),score=55.92 GGOE01029998.1:179-1480(-)